MVRLESLPTDTIYGVVGKATNKKVAEQIYDVCKRDRKKAFIITIASVDDLALFGISANEKEKDLLDLCPGRVSVVLSFKDSQNNENFSYLHRGLNSIAVRLSGDESFIEFLEKTGPLITTSANPEGFPQSNSIEEAEKYFGEQMDFYIDFGIQDNKGSTVVVFDENDEMKILRQGDVNVEEELKDKSKK